MSGARKRCWHFWREKHSHWGVTRWLCDGRCRMERDS